MSERVSESSWPWGIAVAAMLPVLYVLSIAPVVWLVWKVPLPKPVMVGLTAFYWPLEWGTHQMPVVREPLDRYAFLFVDKSTPPANR